MDSDDEQFVADGHSMAPPHPSPPSPMSAANAAACALAALASDRMSPASKSGAQTSSTASASGTGCGSVAAEEAQGQGPHAKKGQRQTFLCGLCMKETDVAERVLGFSWGRTCKRSYDSLSRMSKRQGEESWWEECKANPKKMKMAILDYCKMFLGGCGRGGVRGKAFKIAEYREKVKTSTEVQRRSIGKMMWEEEWIDYARSVAGGGYKREEAKDMWDEWAKPGSGVLRSNDGPTHSPLMLRVRTGMYVDDVNTFSVGKEVLMTNGPTKKPTDVDLSMLREKVMSGHDSVGGMDIVADMSGVARGMVDSSSAAACEFSGAFNSEGLVSIDLRRQLINKRGGAKCSKASATAGGVDDAEDLDDPPPPSLMMEKPISPQCDQRKGHAHSKRTRSTPITSQSGPWIVLHGRSWGTPWRSRCRPASPARSGSRSQTGR